LGFYVGTVHGEPSPDEDQNDSVQSRMSGPSPSGRDYSKVTLVVYSGVEVPSVVEMPIKDAKIALAEKWFVVDQQWGDTASTQQEVGKVMFQEPGGGEAAEEGSSVKVWVSYTEVPEVTGAKVDDAVAAMENAWFVVTLKKDQKTEDESKWGRVYSQSIQAKERYAETGVAVELNAYDSPKLPDEKTSHPVLGAWEGYTINNGRTDGKNKSNRYIEIQSVDHNGNFKGFYESAEKSKYKVLGTVKGDEIFIHSHWFGGEYKYKGILNTQQMTIKGTWSSICSICPGKSEWRLIDGHFYLKKK